MAVELDRQKELLHQATEEVEAQKEKIEGISLKLSRYLPVQLYEQIFSGSLDIHKKSERKKLTIFFSDIVGFTSISEQIEAEEISEFLSFHLTEMSAITEKFGGTIDKFIGDAIMVFYGDPQSDGDVQDAKKLCRYGHRNAEPHRCAAALYPQTVQFPHQSENPNRN
jgi:adenylate cyclase